jgi:hypothetical protein
MQACFASLLRVKRVMKTQCCRFSRGTSSLQRRSLLVAPRTGRESDIPALKSLLPTAARREHRCGCHGIVPRHFPRLCNRDWRRGVHTCQQRRSAMGKMRAAADDSRFLSPPQLSSRSLRDGAHCNLVKSSSLRFCRVLLPNAR